MKLQLGFIVLVAMVVMVSCAPPADRTKCDRESEAFLRRHRMQIGTEQSNRDDGNLWQQDVAVIVDVPVSATTTQWLEIISFDFWQDVVWGGDDVCCWNETQAWPRVDATTGEFYLAFQRVFVCPNDAYYRRNFDVRPPRFEESQAEYDAYWYKNSFVEESAIVIGTSPVEYALGDKVLSAGWYREDGTLTYVNTLINLVEGEKRSYTVNTILEAVPGDPSTQYKVLGDITGSSTLPPTLITAAFEWFHEAIDDPDHVTVVNPNTGFGEYLYYPSQHASGSARSVDESLNTSPAVAIHSHESVQAALHSFIAQHDAEQ